MNIAFLKTILEVACINVIGVCGVFVVTGMTGFLSLGQAAFMAVGAYTSALVVTKLHMPFIVGLASAVVASALAGLIVALPTMKLRRDFFALVTFGFVSAVTALLNSMVKLTGGGRGYPGIPKFSRTWLLISSAVVVIILVRNFKYSRMGRQCLALRADELAAKSMGINTNRTKLMVFTFSAVITGYAGALYAHYLRFIDPSMFDWMTSTEWVIVVCVGGVYSLTGSVISTFLLAFLPELFRFAAEWRIVIYSLVVLGIVNFKPTGMFGEFELFTRKYNLNYTLPPRGVKAKDDAAGG
ncbi:MAG: branched-chain amino acid ABC transporter permease [Synergistaceae bacterium]|jgi:branched-chain amino acid transport system permease protein|nr:branched-chain amino acid ABC transporter permease [Synergistaceae bacterium]